MSTEIERQLPKAPVEEPTEQDAINERIAWVMRFLLDRGYTILAPGGAPLTAPPAEAVEADEVPHVPCPDCGDDPKDPSLHADGCRRIGTDLQDGPPWLPFPEPTPEQVEAAAAPAEYVAIEALVVEVARRVWEATDRPGGKVRPLLREFAADVLEVRGQQSGVPVANRERVAEVLHHHDCRCDDADHLVEYRSVASFLLAADVFRDEATVKAELAEQIAQAIEAERAEDDRDEGADFHRSIHFTTCAQITREIGGTS